MTPDNIPHANTGRARRSARSSLRELVRSRDGTAAIEFALLAIPYFLIVFAIIETFVAFTAEQVVSNAVDTLSRQIRTGQITAANTTSQQFRQAFCNQISVLITCSSTEVQTPANLYLDVESYSSFASMPTTIPRKSSTDPYSDLSTTGFTFTPGGAKSLNMVRAYYRWQIITDLLRPYLTNVHPTDGSALVYLIVATAAFQNENYP
ncbi:Flp pilus assembly protein TadG [Rhizobium sp. ERR 922]|uniref:TadE/TadG family type IV pilus assembly protein n=1 Tax=unclassified Rhizobium TaxID=2613769 RepID=UPI00119F8709|nr:MULTISPECIES: TadE/TadG family type IV pilus assembly protein [unclassified Rhizobium]TWB47967.1 Flp pilus assembly protein TadG [Rhizobium sp. ERR 922]TWB89576.1 Flp pilus assembly protein TadG [Rhizobium sp. ERR 942]